MTSFECVSSVQRHPSNTHHYFVSTDLSILLLDDRFVQHPVLKWRHHLRDPVQFTDVVCNALPGPDDFVLLISGSQHRETHCYQYSDKEGTLPPRSTSLPWKVITVIKAAFIIFLYKVWLISKCPHPLLQGSKWEKNHGRTSYYFLAGQINFDLQFLFLNCERMNTLLSSR